MSAASVEFRPLIGITPDETQTATGKPIHGQTPEYGNAIFEAGGVPSQIHITDNPLFLESWYQKLDGVVLSGGLDIHPRHYKQSTLPTTKPGELANDWLALQVIEWARRDRKPLFAICRGMQLMNVEAGGTLYQHLPEMVGTSVRHLNNGPNRETLHTVTTLAASFLGRITLPDEARSGSLMVNSKHHQGIRDIGRELKPTAWSQDGLIEAIETTIPGWYAHGVQWHPESLPSFSKLFEKFVDACSQPALALVPVSELKKAA